MFPNHIAGYGNPGFPVNQGGHAGGDGPGFPPPVQVVAQADSRVALLASIAPPPPLQALTLPTTTSTPGLGTKRPREDELDEREQTRLRQRTEQEQQALATKKEALLRDRSASYDACKDAELAETLHEALRSGKLQDLTLKSLVLSTSAQDLALYEALSASKLRRLQIEGPIFFGSVEGMNGFSAALSHICNLRTLKCNGTQWSALVCLLTALPQLKILSADLSTGPKDIDNLLLALTAHQGIEWLIFRGVKSLHFAGAEMPDMIRAKPNLKLVYVEFESTRGLQLGALAAAVGSSRSLRNLIVAVAKSERTELDEAFREYSQGAITLMEASRSNQNMEFLNVWLPALKPAPKALQTIWAIHDQVSHEMLERRVARYQTTVALLLACCVDASGQNNVNNDVLGLIAKHMLARDPLLSLRLQDQ